MSVAALVSRSGVLLLLLAVALLCIVASAKAAPGEQDGPARFAVGEPFPDIALPSLENGEPTTLAAYRGEKIILHVFASW